MTLNPFSILALLTALTSLFLSIVLSVYGTTKLHRIWMYFNIVCAGWSFCLFLAGITRNPALAYDFWRAAHIIGIFTGSTFFHAMCIFCRLECPKLIKSVYIYCFIFSFFVLFHHGFYIHKMPGTFYMFDSIHYLQVQTVRFYAILLYWFWMIAFGICQLYLFYKRNQDETGFQALWWTVFVALGYIGGLSTFIPMSGVKFYPYTLILVPIYALGMTYSIFKMQFMQIRVAIEKGLIYSILIATLTIAYLTLVISLEKFFQNFLGYRSTSISIFSAFVIGLLIIPWRNRLQHFFDRIFLKGTAVEIAAQNEQLREEITRTEKYKSLATVTGGIATEIKNPLTSIMGYSHFLKQKHHDEEFIGKFSKVLEEETSKIKQLIEQLTEYSNPAPLTLEKTDAIKLLNDTLVMLKSSMVEHNIELNRNFDKDTKVLLDIDPGRVRQAVLNILLNAIEAMPKGGRLNVETELSNKDFKIRIADTGCGIKSGHLARIFDPFFTDKEGHTGLGLSTVQGIIESHGGKVRVKSQAGAGSQFTIELPLHKGGA